MAKQNANSQRTEPTVAEIRLVFSLMAFSISAVSIVLVVVVGLITHAISGVLAFLCLCLLIIALILLFLAISQPQQAAHISRVGLDFIQTLPELLRIILIGDSEPPKAT